MVLTDCDKHYIESVLDDVQFIDTCTVISKVKGAANPSGGFDYETVEKKYKCSIQKPASSKEILIGDKVVSSLDVEIHLKLNAQVNEKDKITSKGINYEVIATNSGVTGINALIAYCKKVK